MSGGFQTQVNLTPAPAVEGDFASANPRSVVLAGPGGLVSGPNGVVIGKFGWVESDFRTVNSFGSAPAAPDGFIDRPSNMPQALITQFLGIATQLVPQGMPVTLHRSGDFWAKNLGPAALTRGAQIYAGYADGGIYSSVPAGASVTATVGSTNTASLGATFTAAASVASPTLVITAVTGLISIGDAVAGSGITDNPVILAQVSGTAGGAGTYTLSKNETCTGGTVTCFGNVLNVTAVSTYISVGDTVVKSTDFPAGVTIAAQLTGTAGGAGLYQLSVPATAYTASGTSVLTYGITIKVTAVGSGTLAVGEPITDTTTAANVATGAVIASQVNGTPGGTGVYTLSLSSAAAGTYAAGDTLTTVGGVATAWYAIPTNQGDGAVGSLVKISLSLN